MSILPQAFGDFGRAYNKLEEPRSRFKIWLYLSLTALAVSTLFLQFIDAQANSSQKAFSNLFQLLIAVATSVTAAALIEIFSGVRDIWLKEQTQKKFREFFGGSLESNSVAIVIPRFPTESLPPELKETDLDGSFAVKKLKDADERVLAFSDVKTASDILIAFSRAGLPLPEFRWDDRLLDELRGGQKVEQFKTFITIGLYSNQFTMDINNNSRIGHFFRLNDVDSSEPKILLATYNGNNIEPEAKWEQIKSSSEYEYVLISKVILDSGQTTLVIGGIGAKGTEKIGEFIREKWQDELYNWADPSSNIRIEGNQFSAVLRVPLSQEQITKCRVVVPKPRTA